MTSIQTYPSFKLPDLLPMAPEQLYFVVDSQDLIGKVFDQIAMAGERPLIDYNNKEVFEQFMADLCTNIEYLQSPGMVSKGIDTTLGQCEAYTNHPISHSQRLIWRQFVWDLIERYKFFKLYDEESKIHEYEFVRMVGPNILMRYYGD